MKDKTITTYSTFAEAEAADTKYYLSLSFEERLNIFTQIIGHAKPEDGIIERSIRVYPITESAED